MSDNGRTTMRVTARLDDEAQGYVEKIKHLKGLDTVTAVIKYALQDAANSLEPKQPGSKMKALLNSEFIGSGDGPEDLSTNYKDYLYRGLKEKHDID